MKGLNFQEEKNNNKFPKEITIFSKKKIEDNNRIGDLIFFLMFNVEDVGSERKNEILLFQVSFKR